MQGLKVDVIELTFENSFVAILQVVSAPSLRVDKEPINGID
jgi:hypothetical protein